MAADGGRCEWASGMKKLSRRLLKMVHVIFGSRCSVCGTRSTPLIGQQMQASDHTLRAGSRGPPVLAAHVTGFVRAYFAGHAGKAQGGRVTITSLPATRILVLKVAGVGMYLWDIKGWAGCLQAGPAMAWPACPV
jgi:hypothetical protein